MWLWATIKKAECRRIGAFKLCCRRRLLRVPWTPRRSNQSIVKEISSEYSLEGLMLKFQYFCPLMWRAYLLENILILGKIEGRRRGWQRMRWLDTITHSVEMNLSKLRERVESRGAYRATVHAVTESRTQLSDWTTNNWYWFLRSLGADEIPPFEKAYLFGLAFVYYHGDDVKREYRDPEQQSPADG